MRDTPRPHRRGAALDRSRELDTAGDAWPGCAGDRWLPLRRHLSSRDRHPRAGTAGPDSNAAGDPSAAPSHAGHRHHAGDNHERPRLALGHDVDLSYPGATCAHRSAGAAAGRRLSWNDRSDRLRAPRLTTAVVANAAGRAAGSTTRHDRALSDADGSPAGHSDGTDAADAPCTPTAAAALAAGADLAGADPADSTSPTHSTDSDDSADSDDSDGAVASLTCADRR